LENRMKALRFYGKEDMRLIDVVVPEPTSGEVQIRVKASGICGSDLHEYTSGPMGLPVKAHPRTGKRVPDITLGHEFSGEISKVSTDVTGFEIGDRVTVRPSLPCCQCKFCREGRPTLCPNVVFLGINDDGAFAPYLVTQAVMVYKIPKEMTYEQASFCEPLAVATHGVRKGQIGLNTTVAITGAGPIGLLALQAAMAAGASRVFMIEPIGKRRDLARELGATAVFDPTQGDPGKEIAKLTGGLRAEVTLECAGSQEAMLLTPVVTARGGIIVQIGVMIGTCNFPFALSWAREQTIIPSNAYDIEFPMALDLLARKKVKVEPLISARISLGDIVEKGFRELTGPQKTEHIKILVFP
jgi:(R,R)-butanediol dehydrogenase / meso-butanediol dehydrogenase / diacetyl reductase